MPRVDAYAVSIWHTVETGPPSIQANAWSVTPVHSLVCRVRGERLLANTSRRSGSVPGYWAACSSPGVGVGSLAVCTTCMTSD